MRCTGMASGASKSRRWAYSSAIPASTRSPVTNTRSGAGRSALMCATARARWPAVSTRPIARTPLGRMWVSEICAISMTSTEIRLQERDRAVPRRARIIRIVVIPGRIGEGVVGVVAMHFQLLVGLLHRRLEPVDHGGVDPLILVGELTEDGTLDRFQFVGRARDVAVIDHRRVERPVHRRLQRHAAAETPADRGDL